MKRLLRLFKEDVEHIDEDSEHTHDSTENKLEMKQKREIGKEVDAKIVYQYPKGAFRFPLVPDDDKQMKNRSNRPVRPDRKQEQELSHEPPRQERKRRHSPPVKQEPVTRKRVPEPEQEHRNSRPFKPTDIPSPVFGYKERPEIRKGSLQYGVEKIENKVDDKKDPINRELYHRYSQTWGGAPVIVKPSDKRFNPLDLSVAKRQVQKEELSPPVVEPEEIKAEWTGEPEIVNDEVVADRITGQEVQQIDVSQTEISVEEPIDLNDFKEENNEQLVLTREDSDASLISDEEQEMVKEEQVLEELESPIIEESEPLELELTESCVDEPERIIDEEFVNELPSVDENQVVDEESRSQTEADEGIKSAEAEPIRSAIPFNVIMLNQDKLRLMEKELNKTTSRAEMDESVEADVSGSKMDQEVNSLKADSNEDKTVVIADQSFQVMANMAETAASAQRTQDDSSHEVKLQVTEQKDQETSFSFPSIDLLTPPVIVEDNNQWIDDQKELLNTTLKNFNVGATVVNVTQGPSVTRFEVQPEPGVKVNKITNLSDDIKLSLAARDIRIEAPIPGKHTIGIEVPNNKSRPVYLSEIVSNPEFLRQDSPLTAALGLDISGKPIVSDLRKMPHGLIAGATGSGKSVCINTILVSFLYKAKPEDLKLLLIDPKMVELAPYNHIPHLVSPVITDVKAATAALKWAVEEMERRYELFAHTGVRDIGRFNELAVKHKQYSDKLPYIVIIIDELADLMMMSPADVEEAICRIAQKARACGIHLIIATQRPSVDVITGLIKANIPTRIAFSVSSQVDSRTIIDVSGAEKLLGRGDMLFLENGSSKPIRLQGTFVSDEEIDEVVAHAREQGEPDYLFEQEELLKKAEINEAEDELFFEACEFVIENGGASSSMLQRRFKIGYNRAARLIDMMESHGYISESRGSKPRDVFITDAELESLQMTNKTL
ncbi:DNA translocase FtsK [Bacillus tuaregi]|uniref:DNA translocase FtsK n=1 Tax=Bacillus tuaregi TaxID=1816695 RepID=UPI0011143A37|nr:DNA translocase FtsK [Bacillus tuaregi]